MKAFLTIILVLIMSSAAIATDSEIAIFDEGQAALSRFEDNEIKAWKQIDLQTATFHEKWKNLNKLSRKRNRLVFLYKLQNKPEAIHWNNWKGWLRPVESEKDSESYKKLIPEYNEITSEFELQKKALTANSDLLARRKSFYEKNKDTFKKLEAELSEELSALEKRMDKVRKSQPQQNSSPAPAVR